MSRWIGVFLFLLMALTLISCGGSGGTPGITYTTDWSHRLTLGQITGVSQRINILDGAGLPVSSLIIQNVSAPVESTTFNVPNGEYVLQVQLYSSSNASGTQTGILEVPVVVSGSMVEVKSSVGDPIDAIGITPSQASIQVGRGKQFRAAGLNSVGIRTFIAPDSITWSVLGGVGTVTSDGNFTATAIGTGTIRATHTSSRNGSAVVTGTAPNVAHSKWTVLVYMNGANDLQQYSVLNMNQMEKVASNSDLRFVVQWKQFPARFNDGTFDGTRRYLVKPDTTSNIKSEMIQDMGKSIDMGSTETLHDFIAWGKANYPADRYCLIVWNHGNGWRRSLSNVDLTRAVSYDDEKGTSIQIWDLNQALGSEHFDIMSWDASLMQMMEVAYEIKDNCDYIAGSEESPPGAGLPYDLVFAPFRDNPNQTTKNLSKAFVDGMLTGYAGSTQKITQSVLETSKLPALASALSTLGTELKNNIPTISSAITTARNTSKSYSPLPNRVYRDLNDLCLKLEANITVPSVLSATADVKSAISNAVIWEGHNSISTNSYGISIDFTAGSSFAGSASDYQLMKLAQATQWDEFLSVAP